MKFVGSTCGSRCLRREKRRMEISRESKRCSSGLEGRERAAAGSDRTRAPGMPGSKDQAERWDTWVPSLRRFFSSYAGWEGPKGTMQTGNRYMSSSQIPNKWGLSPDRCLIIDVLELLMALWKQDGKSPDILSLNSLPTQQEWASREILNGFKQNEKFTVLILLDLCTEIHIL